MNDVNVVIKQELPILHAIRVEHSELEAALESLQQLDDVRIAQLLDRKDYTTIVLAINLRHIPSWLQEPIDEWDRRIKDTEE